MTTNGTPKPGDLAVHVDGGIVVLTRRKLPYDRPVAVPFVPGWWCGDVGGLADAALDGPNWRHVPAEDIRALAFKDESAVANPTGRGG